MEKAGFYRLFVWRFAAVLLCRVRQVLTKPGGDVIEQRNRILLWKFNYFKFDFMKEKKQEAKCQIGKKRTGQGRSFSDIVAQSR